MAAAGGEPKSPDALMRRYTVLLVGYLRSIGVPESDVDDAAQDIWTRVFKALPKFESQGPGCFRGWLFRIARNYAEDERQGRRRRPVADGAPPHSRIGGNVATVRAAATATVNGIIGELRERAKSF